MKKDFVEYYSPGSFMAETTLEPIDSWDVATATEMAHGIKERHGATPYGFRFITKGREPDELDSKTINKSNMYYLGGKVETVEEVEARNDPKEEILLSNMKCNGYDKIIVNDNSWRWTAPLKDDDVVLDFNKRN